MNIKQQEKAKRNRNNKYRIARELKISVEESRRISNWTTNHFIVYCYNKIRK